MDQDLKIYLDEQFGRIGKRLDQVDQRFESLEQRFESLEQWFEARFESLERRFEWLDQRSRASESRVLKLITDTSESLQREMALIRDRLLDFSRRLDRQAALIQTGARFSVRMVTWSERVDIALEELKTRVQILEHPPGQNLATDPPS